MAVPGVSGRPGWVKRLMAWLGPGRATAAVVRARGTAPRAAVPPPPDRLDAVLDDLVAGPAAPPAVVLDEPDPAVARVLLPLLSARDAGTAKEEFHEHDKGVIAPKHDTKRILNEALAS